MAYAAKQRAIKPLVTTDTTIYQVTAGKHFVIASLRMSNQSAGTEIVKVGVAAAATPGATEWIGPYVVEANKPVQISGDLVTGGMFITAYNATGGNVVFTLSGWEEV
jgi:hypothetical protein